MLQRQETFCIAGKLNAEANIKQKCFGTPVNAWV